MTDQHQVQDQDQQQEEADRDPENYLLVSLCAEGGALSRAMLVCGEYGMEVACPSQAVKLLVADAGENAATHLEVEEGRININDIKNSNGSVSEFS